MWRMVLLLGFVLLVTACATEREEPIDLGLDDADTASGFTPRVVGPRAEAAKAKKVDDIHKVTCGCTLGLEHGNMVEIGGKFVPLVMSGSKRAFCGKKDLRAKVKGELRDGKFYPTLFQLIRR